MSLLSTEQERDVLRKSIDVLTAFTGSKPRGFTAPAWTPSRHTVSGDLDLHSTGLSQCPWYDDDSV